MSLYNLEIEKHFLACLLQYGEKIWGEVTTPFLGPNDFSSIHQPLFNVIKAQLDSQSPISTVILTEKLKSYHVTLEGIDSYIYLEALRMKPVKPEDGIELLKELKKVTVRRELIEKCKTAERELLSKNNAGFEEMVKIVDSTLSSINTDFLKSETVDVFQGLEALIEERGNNPVDTDNLGLMGPFPSINQTSGALLFPGSYVLIGARTGNAKTSLGFFYNVFVAEKYNLPLLHLDSAEMTVEQLQSRAVCCLSNGRIPLWAVKSGEWRKNKEWVDIIRGDIWPRVKKIDMHYQNIGMMEPKDVVNFIKRFYFKHVGRGNHLVIHDDYQKGIEALGKNSQEYQSVGYKAGAVKSLITDQIVASYWTSVQNNKTGIYTDKPSHEIQDSEGAMGLSDRLIQQATNAFMLRFKTPQELAEQDNRFGNMKFSEVKGRELLGRHYERNLMPVRLPTGKYARNYFNLNNHNFFFEDKGSLRDMMEIMGHSPSPLPDHNDEKLP